MFFKRDLYGNIGVMNTNEHTIPDVAERTAYKQSRHQRVADIEGSNWSKIIPLWLIALVILLILLSR